MIWLLWLGCTGGDTGALPEPIDSVMSVPCPVAGELGLAVHVQVPAQSRFTDKFPVVIRVPPASTSGFAETFPAADLLRQGVAVVRFLSPGETAQGSLSGGTDDGKGANRLAALGCVAAWVVDDFPVPVGGLVVTGLSNGGTQVLAAGPLPVDAIVLWESPLVDQLITNEPAPSGIVDPHFTPGSCTLARCPFPGRAENLRWNGEALWDDVDGDGTAVDEPILRLLPDPDGGRGFVSRELWDEVDANVATVFAGDVPRDWPTRAATNAFWAPRDATIALQTPPARVWYLASAQDHVQTFHEPVRVAQLALGAIPFFRVNPDAAYLQALGASVDLEYPAGTLVADPEAEGALPELSDATFVVAAELEAIDRIAHDTWVPDLDASLSDVIP